MSNPVNPIIVQSDRSVLLEVNNTLFEEARDGLAQFAELVKSPEHIHTYRITPLSLWNAAAAGMRAADMIAILDTYGKFDLPDNVRVDIEEQVRRYGLLKLTAGGEEGLLLTSTDEYLLDEILSHNEIALLFGPRLDRHTLSVRTEQRGHIKQALIKIGFPVEDLAGYVAGDPLPVKILERTREGEAFNLRLYQQQAVDAFYAGGSARGGSGVVVLPCGAGKTLVGIGALEKVSEKTLIIATNTVSVRQWIHEIVNRTTLEPDQVGEYTGDVKEIRPITVTTYQSLTYHRSKESEFEHLGLFTSRNWGLIIYDEVHLLPAPVFSVTAEIQARRRLGLTATLVREDGREDDVFSLIGPKKYDVPWRDLERQGWIAQAICYELRVPLPEDRRREYAVAATRDKYRVAAENPAKIAVVEQLLERHKNDQVLIIGQYIEQIEEIAAHFQAPLITGKMPNRVREDLYAQFRDGRVKLLVVSKVANFSIDLPDANVAIQVSGTFGSRQEEAQRLGRILRPKANGAPAHFYSVVSKNTRDQEFAANRQLFLTEQGYRYLIYDGIPPESSGNTCN
ncbi:MAG TPA: DNA repair helicase XPB [Armatimonadota bacterium]|nr:DNA repair helicase XPB [Armatimonadota bacterium]